MIARANRILFAVLLTTIAAYLVISNLEVVTLQLTPGSTLSASLGVVTLVIFGAGFILASILGTWVVLKGYFRERALRARIDTLHSNLHTLSNARGMIASGEAGRAKNILSSLVRHDPDNPVFRLEFARALKKSGDTSAAIAILEESRVKNPNDVESLLMLAKLHRRAGKQSLALDQLLRALQFSNSSKLLALARDLACELDEVEQALALHLRTEPFLGNTPLYKVVLDSLEYRKLVSDLKLAIPGLQLQGSQSAGVELESELNLLQQVEALRAFVRGHPECIEGLIHLALYGLASGDPALFSPQESLQYLQRAATQASSATLGDYQLAARLWAALGKLWYLTAPGEQSLALANGAANRATGLAKRMAELELLSLEVKVKKLDSAHSRLAAISSEQAAFIDQESTKSPDLAAYLQLKLAWLAIAIESSIALAKATPDLTMRAAEFERTLLLSLHASNSRRHHPVLRSATELLQTLENYISSYQQPLPRISYFRNGQEQRRISHNVEVSPTNSTP